MKKEEFTEEEIQNLLKSLKETIEEGPWNESNFLRAIGKNLQDIYDDFSMEVTKVKQSKLKRREEPKAILKEGSREVFITLYSTEGSYMQSWERIITNLPIQVTSRPVYTQEIDARSFIKSKQNKINEAYLTVYINDVDVLPLPPEKIAKDKFGKPLLSLKDKAIQLENITRFTHQSGTYTYSKGRLTKINNEGF